jgi:hypothetical protein
MSTLTAYERRRGLLLSTSRVQDDDPSKTQASSRRTGDLSESKTLRILLTSIL